MQFVSTSDTHIYNRQVATDQVDGNSNSQFDDCITDDAVNFTHVAKLNYRAR